MVLMRLIKGIPSESQDRKGTNKKRIFSCPRESKEFEANIFYLLEAITFQFGLTDFQPSLKLFI